MCCCCCVGTYGGGFVVVRDVRGAVRPAPRGAPAAQHRHGGVRSQHGKWHQNTA